MSALARLRGELRDGGGLLAGQLLEQPIEQPGPAARAARGPRAAAAPDEYELLLEAIYEGYLLHYGASRLLSREDADLALLAGDRLYALGLERLVALGDIAAVGELADVISLCALAHAREDADLAAAVWAAGARAVGWGGGAEHEQAKRLARAGDPRAAAALREIGERGT